MRQEDIAATVVLVFMSFITMVLAIAFNMVRENIWEQLLLASETLGHNPNSAVPNVTSTMIPLLNNLTTVFWTLFLLFLSAGIIVYLVGSHRDEHETYRPPQRYPPR